MLSDLNPALLPLALLFLVRRAVKAIRVFIYGGRVIKIYDGDTVTVRRWFYKVQSVRLSHIDTPEMDQEGGKLARKGLIDLIPIGSCVILDKQSSSYSRDVSNIYRASDGVWINEAMIIKGYAWWYGDYSKDEALEALHKTARRKKKGIFKYKAIKPWEWRKADR